MHSFVGMVLSTQTSPNGLPPDPGENNNSENSSDNKTTSTFRTMPHNLEAEKSLLGAIFINNRAYEEVSEFLSPEHFAYPQHGRIFQACTKLIERGQIADPTTSAFGISCFAVFGSSVTTTNLTLGLLCLICIIAFR